MQTSLNTSETAVVEEPADSGYVGKHRPSRLSLLHPRVRVGKLSSREMVAPAK